ncbi:MAG: lysophospholipid acyltransferase family protein [Pseudomonadota bacterium]
MSMRWEGDPPPSASDITAFGWVRVIARGLAIVSLILLGLAIMLPLRVIERPLFGQARPWTPWITQAVCRLSLACLGLRFVRRGRRMQGHGAIVANHSSWLDIFVLNASDRLFFVSKAEVSAWPGIGALARVVGTVFIARDRKEAKAQTEMFEHRLLAGQRLLFFPEGTSTDGLRVLPFKTTLFAALFAEGLRETCAVQPISVTYHAPKGCDPRTYGWWGDMGFGSHLVTTLALARQGRVDVVYHAPLNVADMADRKALARAAEADVRAGHGLADQTQLR